MVFRNGYLSANGEITRDNHPFKTWSFEWDLSGHPEGESDVTFRVRAFDGLDTSRKRPEVQAQPRASDPHPQRTAGRFHPQER